ncbi:ABC transporter ATP-binding protein [Infirmifilum lucidum]|uniref:ABC transporter ATP-binding protein n=1 Tax=Infirmifilum lucidum TaxID=2776706 RepID=UPI001CECBB2F|nr:ABC transporter ATP-binding protein [Infirmifilum lucidum]
MYAVEARGLRKSFMTREGSALFRGRKRVIEALKGVTFEVRTGEVFGLLGPNGAGKTTTIKILSTLLLPDAGEAWVNGYNVVKEARKVRESIGVSLYSDRGFYWKLSGRENLLYFASLYHIEPGYAKDRVDELLALLGLEEDADRLVEEYSTGMKSKLNIARALLHDPPILFLDEPTIGLDPNSARKVREIIVELRKKGKAILLTTHNMFEADMLSDRVAIMSRGRIVAVGSPSELKRSIAANNVVEIEVVGLSGDNSLPLLGKIKGVLGYATQVADPSSGRGTVRVIFEGDAGLKSVLDVLVDNNLKILSVRTAGPTLEDVFVRYAGERLEGES